MLTSDVLVVGAGMAGLVAAENLSKTGLSVVCVEKARGSGGRLSSKRVRSAHTGEDLSFDLGCTSFTAYSELFRAQLESWVTQGVADVWHYSHTQGTHYVGTPRNSSITRNLADRLDVTFSTRITALLREGDEWCAYVGEPSEQKLYCRAKHVVLAIPPQQAADLLDNEHPFKSALSEPVLLPQWVLMLHVKGHLQLSQHFYELTDSPIHRLILEESKPGRTEQGSSQIWVIQASPEWSAECIDESRDKVANQLIAALASLTGSPVIVEDQLLHRWLYAIAQNHSLSGKGYLHDGQGLWFCGDYLAESETIKGVEAAFTSGHLLARNFAL